MGWFNKMNEPVFLKQDSNAEKQLEKLKSIEEKLNDEGKKKLHQEIRNIEAGILGENNIAFELKNSHIPMYILHDIYLECDGLTAQIDYLIFTKKICFIIECKNLYGDIEINNSGDFIRIIDFGGKKKKEGIYSPITQNQRHLELIRKLVVESKTNIILKWFAKNNFDTTYKPIVVLANPKTVLYDRFAKKEIKNKIIRADQLVSYIKKAYNESSITESSEDDMFDWARKFLSKHKNIEQDYISKFDEYYKPDISTKEEIKEPLNKFSKSYKEEIIKKLKEYRLNQSRKENIKPYIIFTDTQLNNLLEEKPKSLDDLKKISGFTETKVKKYGNDILNILNKKED